MKYLTKVVETWRLDTENEAKALIEEAKNDYRYVLSRYSTDYKYVKETKTRDEDEYWLTTLTKVFTDPKAPEQTVEIEYVKSSGVTEEEEDEE